MAKKKLSLIEQVEKDNLTQSSPFNQEGIKSFVRDAGTRMGKEYTDEQVNGIINHYGGDYDALIDDAGAKTGITDFNKFRVKVYTKYKFRKPNDLEAAEMEFIKMPVASDPEGGYEKYNQLQEELNLTNAFIDNIKSTQPTQEEEIIDQTGIQPSDVTQVQIDQVLEPTDPRISSLLEKKINIEKALQEQHDFNYKKLGYGTEEAEVIGLEREKLKTDLKDARDKMFESATISPSYGAPGQYHRTFATETEKKVRAIDDMITMYDKMIKLENAPQRDDKKFNALMYGLGNNFFTQDFVTLGLSEMSRLINVKDAFETRQKLIDEGKSEGEIAQLMPEEQLSLINTYQTLLEIQAGANPNNLYYWGEGLKDMIPFIVQFAATEGTGTIAKEAVKNYIKNATLKKATGFIAKSMTQAALMVPANLQGYAQRVAPTMDEEGNLVKGMNPLQAAVITYLNTVAEVVGEDVGTMAGKAANKSARAAYRKMIGGNPNMAQKFLGKMALALTTDTNVPTIQGVAFEGLGEEVTGLLQAVINKDDSFFESEAQKQIWGMSLIASGTFMSTSLPGRLKARTDFNKATTLLEDIPNGEYANAVEQLITNFEDVEDIADALGELNKQFGENISQEDKIKARIFIEKSVVYNQMNTARSIRIQEQISQNIGNDGNVTMTTYQGKPYTVRNPQDLGQEGKVLFLKDPKGKVTPVISSKIDTENTETKSPDQIVEEQITAQDQNDDALQSKQEQIDQIRQSAIDKGLEEGKTVETPQGKKTLVSINPDGTSTVVNDKGEESTVNTDEIEPYKTQEQKDAEKAEQEAEQAIMEGISEGANVVSDEPIEGTDIRVVDFDNGQSKIITPEGEQLVNSEEERNQILSELLPGEIEAATPEATIDDLTPEEAFMETRKTDPEIANEVLLSDIESIRSQAEEQRNAAKEVTSRQEKIDMLTAAKNLEAEAARLEEILNNPPELVDTVTEEVVPEEPISKHEEPKVVDEALEEVPFRAAPETPGITEMAKEDLASKNKIIPLLEELQRSYGIPIQVLNSSEMPEHVKAAAGRKKITASGFYDPTTGIAYIISDNINRVSDVKKTYMHEAVLHKGLDVLFEQGPVRVLNKEYQTKNNLLDEVFKRLDKETIADRAKYYAKDTPIDQLTDSQKRELAEEAMATLNETESPRLQVFLYSLYNFFRKLFGFTTNQFSKAEFRQLLRDHRDLIIKNKQDAEAIRRNEGQVPSGRNVQEGGYEEGGQNIQQPEKAGAETGDKEGVRFRADEGENIIETPEGLFELNEDQIKQRKEMAEKYGQERADQLIIDFIDLNDLRKYNKPVFRVSEEAFYSPTERALESIQQDKGTVSQFESMLLKNGAKQAELDWMGFREAFPSVNSKVTKEDIQNWIDQNKVEIKEVTLGGVTEDEIDTFLADEAGEGFDRESAREYLKEDEADLTKYSDYQLPGGKNYKELLLTMPVDYKITKLPEGSEVINKDGRWWVRTPDTGKQFIGSGKTKDDAIKDALFSINEIIGKTKNTESYRSSHFDEPNILAHTRFNERTDSEGNRVLFLEEIQSDWAQEGKKKGFKELSNKEFNKLNERRQELERIGGEYRNRKEEIPNEIIDEWVNIINKIQPEKRGSLAPNMPFKKTDQWVNLALRRMIRYAAENGFDKVAWTTGEQQSERYDLSKQIDHIGYTKDNYLSAWDKSGNKVIEQFASEKQLPDIIGKEAADKLINQEPDGMGGKSLQNQDLKVGGEGMKAFYNQIIPKAANKLGKKFGSKVETTEINTGINEEVDGEILESFTPDGTQIIEFKGDTYEFETEEEANDFVKSLKEATSKQLSIPITPKMKESVLTEGVPMFRVEEAREQVNTNPSEAQKKAGNYAMGHVRFDGFDISIENPKGGIRQGVNDDGEKWSNILPADYGYFRGTVGKDKDHIDVFLGDNLESDKVYVVDQINPKTGAFDEHKVLMGYNSLSEAKNAYMEAYDEGWQGLGNISRTTKEGLKEWFKNGDTKKSFAPMEEVKFQVSSNDPKVQAMLDKLVKIQALSREATKLKEMEAEAKTVFPEMRQTIEDQIAAFKAGIQTGKKDTKDLIKEVQKTISDYAKKVLPLTEAGAREISPVLTLVRNAQTPEDIESAINRIDELAGKTEAGVSRRKNVAKVNRLLKWMTSLKKSGMKKVGKFNYEDTKAFMELKDIDKKTSELTRILNSTKRTPEEKLAAEAELDQLWETINSKENKNSLYEATMKLIELRKLGSKASPELAQAVAEELEVIYKDAKDAKSEADIEAALTRTEDKEFVKDFLRSDTSLDKMPVIKRAIKRLNTWTGDIMGNWETLMTMIGGQKLRDKTSLMLNEAEMAVGRQESIDNVLNAAMDAYGSKSRTKTLNKIHDLSAEEYSLIPPNQGEGDPMKLSKLQLIDIYNAIKNENIANDYFLSYGDVVLNEDGSRNTEAQRESGQARIEELLSNLSDQDKAFADAMQIEINKYYDKMNAVHIKLYNRDLPRVEGSYWPSTVERESDIDLMDAFTADIRYPGSTKERANRRTPIPTDAFNKFAKHVDEAEWFVNMALPINDVNKLFKDVNIKRLIEDKRGDVFYKNITQSLQNVSLMAPGKLQQSSKLTSFLNPLLNNWVASKIGATPSVPLKQLLSAVNYAENMPAGEWATGFVKGLVSPKDTWAEMMKIPYLKTRLGNGYSEAVQRALNGDEHVHKSRANNYHSAFKNLMTIGTRYGDIAAIIFGGKPYLDYLLKSGLSEKEAVDKFLQDTLRSQQAPFSSTLSKLQNSKNPFFRALFAFSNTPSQYMRKLFEAQQNLRVARQQYKAGKISEEEFNQAKKVVAKAHTIYGIINTVTFTMAGSLINAMMKGSDPDDEVWKDMIAQLSQTYLGGLPIIKDIVNRAARQLMGMKVYDASQPFVEGLDQSIDAAMKLSSGEAKNPAKEYEKIGQGVATMLGVPYYNLKKDIQAIPPFRENTVTETRVKEVDEKLKSLKNSDPGAGELKQVYTIAKSKATRLRNAGNPFMADIINNMIEDSKLKIRDNNYNDLDSEATMLKQVLESLD